MECCLELLDRGLLVALQDLGAAGLTSSAAEMAAGGGVGVEIAVDRVPLREPGMEPFEIMISESQERMLAVIDPASTEEVLAVCTRWQTGAATIGRVTDTDAIRVTRDEEVVADLPISALIDECPLYDLEPQEPEVWLYGNSITLDREAGPNDVLTALLASPNVASKRWAFEQYDSIVQSRTVRRPGSADAAVLRLEETGAAIAVSIDGNGRRVACDPYRGTIEAVLECAQNLACVGAQALGLTNCLNFGNPERPHVAWQLDRSVQGLADACEALDVPVVGGNVSLYNETEDGPIYPTPVVGMVGELPDAARAPGIAVSEGDTLALVGPFAPSVAGSELAKLRGDLGNGLPGASIGAVRKTIELVRDAVRAGVVTAAHDVSDGGLACALAESAVKGGVGVSVDLDELVEKRGASGEACLFGEGPGGICVAGSATELEALAATGGKRGVDVMLIGRATGDRVVISAGEAEVSLPIEAAARAWRSLRPA
jgi:phosphoribosylformylglycinamidine synthase